MEKFNVGNFLYLSVFVIFFIKGILLFDPDLGWHLRMGQIILSDGIAATDPLSYTMASFPFIDHEWLTNVFLYAIYPFGGLITLSIIFSLMVIMILRSIFGRLEKLGSVPAFLLTSGILLSFFGVRTQVLSWVFVTILLKILLNEKKWSRLKSFLPILLLLWTNLHGSFAIGVAFLILFGVIQTFQRKLKLTDGLIILLSIGATFINPYQGRIWQEVFRQFFDSNLKNEISEWAPGIYSGDILFWSLFVLTSALITYDLRPRIEFSGIVTHWVKIRQLSENEKLTLPFYLVLLYAALSTIRHIPFWTILAGQLLLIYFGRFTARFHQDKFALKTIPKFVNFSGWLIGFLFLLEIGVNFYNYSKYTENSFYPKDAVSYLKSNLPKGQIFSLYSWGGYLDWNLAEKKVFIDGRMPSWIWQAPKNESDWAFADYRDITIGNHQDQYFQKYNIDTVVWRTYKKPDPLNNLKNRIFSFIAGAFHANVEDPQMAFSSRLQQSGWRTVYQDKNSIILQK